MFRSPNTNIFEILKVKSELLFHIRSFFYKNNFLEVDTPIAVKAPLPEEYIEPISIENGLFLRTSPEPEMKILVANGHKKIFQIGKCFRKDEKGKFHDEEFLMLEWYETDADYLSLADFTEKMITYCVGKIVDRDFCVFNGRKINFARKWDIISVEDAFLQFAGVSSKQALSENKFEEILVSKVEPKLGLLRPCILIDFPAKCSAFASLKTNTPDIAERWELYIAGVEIANTYTELRDPSEFKKRLKQFTQTRQKNKMKNLPENIEFIRMIESGFPKCAGCALGLDRLVMLLTDTQHISAVTHFQCGNSGTL